MEHDSNPASEQRTERSILFFTCAAHALTHIYMVIYSAVIVRMNQDFGEKVYWYATICVIVFGMGSIPASYLGEKLGEKRLLVAFFLLTAAGGASVGLAHSTWQLAFGMTLLGLGASIFHPVGNTLIAKGIRLPGRAMGVNGLWGSIGEAIGPILAGGLTAWLGSWRYPYLVLTLPTLAIGLWLAVTRIDLKHATGGTTATTGAPSLARPLRRAPVALLTFLLLAMMCGGFQLWIVKTTLPEFVGKSTSSGLLPVSLGNPEFLGPAVTSIMYLVGGTGQLVAGRVVHRREGRGVYALVFLVSIPLILLTARLTNLPLLVTGSLMALLMFSAQPIENVLLARFAPASWKSFFFGLKFTLAFGVGGLGVRLCGWARQGYGLDATFNLATAFCAAALFFALLALLAKSNRQLEPEVLPPIASLPEPRLLKQ